MRKDMNDTIAAVSTPIGEGGIGIVRLSGTGALKIADSIFVSKSKTKPSKARTHTLHYGHIVDKKKTMDEVIVTVMRAPKTYTREDIIEINCHGGIQALKKVLELVIKKGAKMAEPGEFTKRAFLNGRLSLDQAEAVLDVIRAKTEGSLKVAIDQLEGHLSKRIDVIRDNIIELSSQIEASIDFPDEELEIINKETTVKKVRLILDALKGLLETYDEGVIFREGVLAIICGKPNVGKSSLMNLLLKRDRVIVSPIPGTTRDAVEEMINLKGVPIRLVDTAGIGKAKDTLENEGVARSKKYLTLADIAIVMLDASTRIEIADRNIVKLTQTKKRLVVINKSDLPKKVALAEVKKIFKGEKIVEISVEKRHNIKLLEDAISDLIWRGDFNQGEGALVTNLRHKELLDKALKNMLSVKNALEEDISSEVIAIDLKEAVNNLGLIIGKTVSDDVLDRIFEHFCIGK